MPHRRAEDATIVIGSADQAPAFARLAADEGRAGRTSTRCMHVPDLRRIDVTSRSLLSLSCTEINNREEYGPEASDASAERSELTSF